MTSPRPSFAILVAISAIGPLALNIFIPSMPGLQREFAVSYGTAQLTLTLYLIGMAACQLIYGPLSDRLGRRPLLIGGMAVFVVASVLAALAPTIGLLIAARLFQALGGAAGIVLARAMVRDLYDRAKAASVISYITMAFVVAPMVAPAMGGVIDRYAAWRADFWLLSAIGAIVLAFAWFHLPETHEQRGGSTSATGLLDAAGRLFATAAFRSYTLTLAFTSAVFFAFLGGAPHIMVDVLKRTPMEYGLWFFLVSFGYMLGNYSSGRFTERTGIDRMMLYGCAITLGGGLLSLAAAVSGLLSPATLFLPMALAALGNGLTIPNGTTGAISVDQRLTGSAAGWAGFAQMACGAAASQLVGSLQNGFPLAVFWFMAVASVLAILTHWHAMARA
ncbi:MAG: multidrug effflux MFS transporter [Rhizobiales bacterium]|nr:multidrug effflux MFS transporter [Hyphomicrobiales bacterium]MBI3674546.1 multidrug effflux MFS transporter [Hyphomicrobiales bacterium]